MSTGLTTHVQATRLILKHRASLYSYVYACVRNHADAEDIFQEVSIAVLESISQLRDEGEFLVWAREIAFRRLMACIRKNKKEVLLNPHVIGSMAEAIVRFEQGESFSREREMLLECLEVLPQKSKDLILLRYEDTKQELKEVASRQGLALQTVYYKIKRIKEILRKCISRKLLKEST